MIKAHASRDGARAAVGAEGYQSGFSSPGRPELWIKGKSRVAIARRVIDADEDWVIVPYPEPAVATHEQCSALVARDGIVLHAGKLPHVSEITTTDPDLDLL